MSLRVWLPLTKDLRNQGLDTVMVTQNNGTAISGGGKLGSCLTATSNATVVVNFSSLAAMLANGQSYSLACWVKITGNVTTNSWIIKLGTNSCGLWWAASEARWVWNENDNGKRCANPTISADTTNWHHLVTTVTKSSNGSITTAKHYVDGIPATSYEVQTWDNSGNTQPTGTTITISPYAASLNDIRLYDHCLSPMEIKELAKGLVLHYPLNRQGWGQENLLIGTHMDSTDRAGWVSNSSTDWTKYFRYYNGSASIHSFANGEDTITLNSASNLGICFVRKATDINLDSSSYYTLSCEAKSTQTAKQMCIGLSYYNNSNSWVWRGGSNGQSFTASNKWQKFTLTFKPDADTQYICYCFTVVGVANGTDTWTIRNCKLEKNSIATPWCPNSSDALATTMGLNSTTEYDCSGFCNNGTRIGTLTWTSDTPKYEVSTEFNGTNATIDCGNGFHSQGAQELTFSCWVYSDNWGSGTAQYYLSSQETGGIIIVSLASSNNIRARIHAYTAADLSTYSYYQADCAYTDTGISGSGWHMLTGVYTTSSIKLYIDGILKKTTSLTTYGIHFNNTAHMFLAAECAGTSYSNLCNCKLSDVRIYVTALSADDVKSLYQNSAYIDSSGNVYGAVHTEV